MSQRRKIVATLTNHKFKGLVHAKTKIMSLMTHPHVPPSL